MDEEEETEMNFPSVDSGLVSNVLQQAIVPFVNLTLCAEEYPQYVDETMVCAGRVGVGACHVRNITANGSIFHNKY